ncbi:hypothetical protein [Paraburkholderia phenazinium]|uniref:hypothetical protein n=1 Tax=Paraburkholderia phenazinium TaxID=60549 RepID=UPI00115FFCD6|nr:hypothetical protein [Paraburkholderia phenazinium]
MNIDWVTNESVDFRNDPREIVLSIHLPICQSIEFGARAAFIEGRRVDALWRMARSLVSSEVSGSLAEV